MTARERKLKLQMKKRITTLCEEIKPVAKQVYFTPAYHKQKDALRPKFPLNKLIDKDEVVEISQAITSGNMSAAAEQLSTLNDRLMDFEARMDKKRRR